MFHDQKGGGAHMGMGTNIYQTMGVQAGIEIFSHILFIAIAFYALQSVRLEVVFKKGKTFQIQLMYILLSIALGYTVSDFLIDFTGLSRQLPYIFSSTISAYFPIRWIDRLIGFNQKFVSLRMIYDL